MNVEKSVKKMLIEKNIAPPDKVVFNNLVKLINWIEDNNGEIVGVFSKTTGRQNGGNKLSQSIYRLIKTMNNDIYKEIAGVSYPISPKSFLLKLHYYWVENYKD